MLKISKPNIYTDIKIQNFTVNIYEGDTTFFSNQKNNQNQKNSKSQNGTISKADGIEGLEDVNDYLNVFERLNILA